jgi:hypothetical protein
MAKSFRKRVLETFKEYGGWWHISGMAEWLDVSIEKLRLVWDRLEKQGLLEIKEK